MLSDWLHHTGGYPADKSEESCGKKIVDGAGNDGAGVM